MSNHGVPPTSYHRGEAVSFQFIYLRAQMKVKPTKDESNMYSSRSISAILQSIKLQLLGHCEVGTQS